METEPAITRQRHGQRAFVLHTTAVSGYFLFKNRYSTLEYLRTFFEPATHVIELEEIRQSFLNLVHLMVIECPSPGSTNILHLHADTSERLSSLPSSNS